MEITIDDLTTDNIDGSGVFDELMSTMAVRLDDQYTKTRIKGTDYSKVYLGGMEAAMQQSIIFLLGRQKADKEAEAIEESTKKTASEILLIEAQTLKVASEICVIEQQCLNEAKKGLILDAELTGINTNNAILEEKLEGEAYQTTILEKTSLKVPEETLLIQKQVEKIASDILVDTAQISKIGAEISMLVAQEELVGKEEDLMDEKINTEKAQTNGVPLHPDFQNDPIWNNTTKVSGVVGFNMYSQIQQADKADAESSLINAKEVTEEYQSTLIRWQGSTAEYNLNYKYTNIQDNGTAVTIVPTAGAEFNKAHLIATQGIKTAHEASLVAAKAVVESSQILDTPMYWNHDLNKWSHITGLTGDTSEGTVRAQIDLLVKQKDGFDRKAEVDASKLMTDMYSVNTSVNDTAASEVPNTSGPSAASSCITSAFAGSS